MPTVLNFDPELWFKVLASYLERYENHLMLIQHFVQKNIISEFVLILKKKVKCEIYLRVSFERKTIRAPL